MATFKSDCLSFKICIWDQIQAYDILYLLYINIYPFPEHCISYKKDFRHFKILKHFSVSAQISHCQSYRSSDDGKLLGDSRRKSLHLPGCLATTVVFLFSGNAFCCSAFGYSAWTSVPFPELSQALGYDLPCVCKSCSNNNTSITSLTESLWMLYFALVGSGYIVLTCLGRLVSIGH